MILKWSSSIRRAGALIVAAVSLTSVTARASVIWEADPTRGLSVFESLERSPGTIVVTNDPLNQFGQVFRYDTWDDSTYAKERVESKGTVTPSGDFRMAIGSDYYIGWRAMWKPMPIDPGWVALFQMHGYGPSGQPAPLVLRCINGDGNISLQNGVSGGSDDFWHVPFKLGVWQSFVLHVKISADPTVGYCEIWYNGVAQKDTAGNVRHFCQTVDSQSGSYVELKWGCYRSGAMNGKGSATAFMSRARIATTFDEANPPMTNPDFSVSASPSSRSIPVGSGTTYTVSVGAVNSFAGTVTLSAGGLPSGATASFSPSTITSSGTSTMTVTTSGSTTANTSTLTVNGTSGSLSHSTTVTLSMMDFVLNATPSSQTVAPGNSTSYTVTPGSVNGFAGSVTLSVSGLPSGATAAFNPNPVAVLSPSTLTVTTAASTPTGSSTLSLQGTSGGLTHNTSVGLTVGTVTGPTSFEAESLASTVSGGTASLQSDVNSSGGTWVQLAATATGQYIEFTTPSIAAGTYQLQMMWKGNTSRGILNVKVDGTQVGGTLDQYASTQTYPTTTFGNVTFSAGGTHKIRLTVTGKNSSSSAYNLSADKFTLKPVAPTVAFEAENLSWTTSGATAALQSDANTSNGQWVLLNSTATGQYIEYTLPNVPAGTYSVKMSYKSNNNRGILSLKVDGTQVGATTDEYAFPSVYPEVTFGTVTFSSSGNHLIRLTVTGKNSSSSDYGLSADKFTLAGQ
jgi:hypothetical protein